MAKRSSGSTRATRHARTDSTGTSELTAAAPLADAPSPGQPDQPSAPRSAADVSNPRLRVEVEWANIAQARGDVFVVGHYIGVLPQNAERALDKALSGFAVNARDVDENRLMLTDLTRRGAIRGSLGELIFFPWKGKGQIALAGMGRLGTFKEPQLVTLAASVTQSIARLLPDPTICTVLIGAGFGNLSVEEAVAGLLTGASRALENDAQLPSVTLRIVEYRLDRAYEILTEARAVQRSLSEKSDVQIAVADEVIELDDTGGAIPIPFGFSMLLASVAQACFDGPASPLNPTVDALTAQLPKKLRAPVLEALKRLGVQRNAKQLGLAFRLVDHEQPSGGTIADRISFTHDGKNIHAAAITNLTTVAATSKDVSLSWIDRFVDSLRAPSVAVFKDRGRKAMQTLVHPALQEKLLMTDPLVLELDRTMARVPWELVHQKPEDPLAVLRPLARQLRTAYSPRPSDMVARNTWKALVIGNPDNTLVQTVSEAKAVAETLTKAGVEVVLRIGAPDALGLGTEPDVEPADLYEILELLQTGEYDIVHYAGHARFVQEYPDRSGWVFKDDEILTASKLEGVERAPSLIVANACISAALSTLIPKRDAVAAGPNGAPTATPVTDSGIVASLADEFFRRGVADYVGTAWEVAEVPAELFATTLYREFFADAALGGNRASSGVTLGVAVQRARRELFDRRAEFTAGPTVWAAYQHYGDPTRTLGDYRA